MMNKELIMNGLIGKKNCPHASRNHFHSITSSDLEHCTSNKSNIITGYHKMQKNMIEKTPTLFLPASI